jgi:hypothetical protein
MEPVDRAIVSSQLISLKKRVKSQRSSGSSHVGEATQQDEQHAKISVVEPLDGDEPEVGAEKIKEGSLGSGAAWHSMLVPRWICGECSNECIPIMRESRCLCGHRMKEHKSDPRNKQVFPCSTRSCRCAHFFYLVAEGSWILRCRCKHKHTDHDCGPGPHKCSKCSGCSGFDSPWVCNCGHTWSAHKQIVASLAADAEDVTQQPPKKQQHFYRQDGLDKDPY